MEPYVTIIASNFVQPITTVAYNLVRKDREGTEGKTNEVDLDWIFSGILLSVVMFEASLRWTQRHRRPNAIDEGFYLYESLRRETLGLPDVAEAFVLRNVIAHGHVWEVHPPRGALSGLFALFQSGWKNKLWRRYVVESQRTTRSGLNVVPTLMRREDFRSVLELIIGGMRALIHVDLLLPQALNHHPVWPDGTGERIAFSDLPARIH